MTICKPDTCDCVFNVEQQRLITRCKEHATYEQMVSHARSINLNADHYADINNPTREEIESLSNLKRIEKQRIRDL